MATMTCAECGNTDSFVHVTLESEVVYYDNGEQYDAKSLDVLGSLPQCCWRCGSEDIGEV